MEQRFFWLIFFAVGLYTIVPFVITRVFGIGIFRKGNTRGEVAFTFDDGPHPVYTEKLLDLLKKHHVRATFFVLGSKAEQHADLVRRMHEEGHQIGIHNYTHRSNWFMLPWTVVRNHVHRSADIVEAITGTRPDFYRPPWGMLSLGDFWLRKDFKIVLWSLMAGDWRKKICQTKLERVLKKRVSGGSVVLLHDSGETIGADRDAPAFMLRALEEVIIDLKKRKFRFVRVDEMMGADRKVRIGVGKRLLVSVWLVWERCFIKLFRVSPIDHSNSLLKLRVREYRGNRTIMLEDGEIIQKGDRIAELHFDNNLLFQLGSDARNSMHLAIQIIRRTEELLPQILHLLQTNPEYRDVKGLYGISIIHRGSRQLGFTVIDLPNGIFPRLTRYYLRLLIYIIHPQGKERLKTKSELLVPKIIAMSKKELMNRYIA